MESADLRHQLAGALQMRLKRLAFRPAGTRLLEVKTMTHSKPVSTGPLAVSRRATDPWRHGEPSLADVMSDPIVHLLMRRDGLVAEQVWPVVREAQARLGRGPCPGVARAA